MDIRWLEDFLALAELRNFTRAAEFRNLSQAAFSRRIQSLEHWLGTGLIVKGSQPVRLTEAGAQFRESAQGSVERLLEARSAIRAQQFAAMSQIRLAMPNVLARSEFKRLLALIGPRAKSSFSVIVGTTAEVTARYLAGDADILFAHDAPALQNPALQAHEPLSAHRRHVLAKDRFLPYAQIGADFGFPGTAETPFPLVSYSQRAFFARLFEHVLSRSTEPLSYETAVQCDMSDVLKEVIAAGFGVGWLPQSTVGQGDLIAPVAEGHWAMDLEICAYCPARPHGAQIEQVWSALTQIGASR